MQYDSWWFESPAFSSPDFDIHSHILCHTRNMSRLEAAPVMLLQSTTNRLPRPASSKNAANTSTNSNPTMAAVRVRINNHVFSKYECEVACAIQLYIRNANNRVPTDETLGYVIKSLRGDINGDPLPCQDMVYVIEHFENEAVRSIYLSVCIDILHCISSRYH